MDIQNNSIQEAIYDKIVINNNIVSEAFTPDGTFHDNMYVFIGDKQGMIDKNGKAFIPVKYDSLGVFSEIIFDKGSLQRLPLFFCVSKKTAISSSSAATFTFRV